MTNLEMLFIVLAGGKSKWNDGDRVRVVADGDCFGHAGTVERQNYSEQTQATAVYFDGEPKGIPAWFADYELEALEEE
ncbi:hypothetical protein [Streptomyces sp. H39-S7]|uniref:hypothetical protein n=1 Tax=Streptomyces sp. H39-S7 TaxID=3004357 RepID=UPI0022AFC037|nr:hypothetical protein [Streptomyces sp. H39-S7]MCZ4119019.1 hypothetical protein [Streptomyces sp. H39-S7]